MARRKSARDIDTQLGRIILTPGITPQRRIRAAEIARRYVDNIAKVLPIQEAGWYSDPVRDRKVSMDVYMGLNVQ